MSNKSVTRRMVVLIPTHGRPKLLARTLASVARCNLPDVYHKLVVIENGSRDGAEAMVDAMPAALKAEYMYVSRGNKSHALNEALAHRVEESALVVFFDDDVRVHTNILIAYARAASRYGPGHYFGGPVHADCEQEPKDWMRELLPKSVLGYDLKETRMGNVYLGLNWTAFAEDLRRMGGFDPRLGPGAASGAIGQESDMQGRMLKAGMKPVDVPGAGAHHYVSPQRMSFLWLLKRRRRGGIRDGIKMEESPRDFAFCLLKDAALALGVAAKGTVLLDSSKLMFALLQAIRHIGTLEGYVWKLEKP